MKPLALRMALVMMLLVALVAPGRAQPCNPVIDGTYCASQPNSSLTIPDLSTPKRSPNVIPGFGNAFSGVADNPGTLGAITFNGDGARCIGLLRRGSCR